mmetsp:Transcript_17656/g.54813  ORF Transcript_17656/g.54813 Transcript_17656/m.54813 type:complete len:210 (+) Transcript_17656:62-691(+)
MRRAGHVRLELARQPLCGRQRLLIVHGVHRQLGEGLHECLGALRRGAGHASRLDARALGRGLALAARNGAGRHERTVELQLARLVLGHVHHLVGEARVLRHLDAKALIRRARRDLVQHGQLPRRVIQVRVHVKVGHLRSAVLQRGELVEVRREKRWRLRDVGQVLGDGPRQAKAVVRGRAAPELIDDDQRRGCGLVQDGGRLEHLGHEG